MFPTQGSNPGLPHCGRILYQLSHTTEALRGEGRRRIKSQILLSLWFCISKTQEASLTSLIAILKVSTWTQLSRTDYSGTLLASQAFPICFPQGHEHQLHKMKIWSQTQNPSFASFATAMVPKLWGFHRLKVGLFYQKAKETKQKHRDFPSGPVVKNLLSNTGRWVGPLVGN